MPMLSVDNPYTTKTSIFANIIPKNPPEVLKDATTVTTDLPYPLQLLQVVIIGIIILFIINLILCMFGVNTIKLFGTLILKMRRKELFGKKVGESELVTVLLDMLEVLGKQTDFERQHTMSILNNVVYRIESILTLLEVKEKEKDADREVFDYMDVNLTHEKYLMTRLVNYLTGNTRIREKVVEESLEAINEGLERVIEEYINSTAKTVEDELKFYNDLKEKQKEQNFDDLIRRD